MDLDQHTPSTDSLRQIPYSELRKIATKYGIQRVMKAEKLISAIMSKILDCDESFSTPAAKELNSSRKNKEMKFDEVQMTPLISPRRGTYSLGTPISVKTGSLLSASIAVNTSDLDISNVTVSRGSERKLRPRKVSFMSPAVTPRTPKNLNLRKRPKTPVASRAPLNESMSSATRSKQRKREESFSVTPEAKIFKFEAEPGKYSCTPLNESMSSVTRSGQRKRKSLEELFSVTPEAKIKFEEKSESSVAQEPAKLTPLPSSKQVPKKDVLLPKASSRNIKSSATKSVVTKEPTSMKKGATPNFTRIHQKAFEKMESIDDYQKRKLLNSAKKIGQYPKLKTKGSKSNSKIPAFSGIPFIPSVSNYTSMKLNSKVNKLVTAVGKHKAEKENTPHKGNNAKSKFDLKTKAWSRKGTPQSVKSKFNLKTKDLTKRKDTPLSVKSKFNLKTKDLTKKKNTPHDVKSKFDLKASLSRKLCYKPHRGPLKPLSESNSIHTSNFLDVKEPVINKVVKENRSQTRSIIRGVRMNKRFELQMKNRKFD